MKSSMREDCINDLVAALKEGGIRLASGVPDGWLGNVQERIEQDPDLQWILAGNEGVAFSICAGAWLGGMKSAIIMENSGLRVASEYIARYSIGFNIPVLLIMSYRGDFGDPEPWAVPHRVVCEPQLKALRIPYLIVRERKNLKEYIKWGIKTADGSQFPAAVLIGGGLVW